MSMPIWYGFDMTLEKYLSASTPKISHAAFGELVGVTQATINRYVSGTRFPSPEMVRKIHDATNGAVGVSDWYSEEQARSKVAAE